MRITHIGGPTVLIEVEGWRLLTDPTFDPPGRNYRFSLGIGSRKLAGPSVEPGELGRIDAVLLSHDHHDDNLDPAGRAMLPSAGVVVTTASGAKRLGGGARGLEAWQTTVLADERPDLDRDRGDPVPPRAAGEQAARRRRDRLRAALGRPAARRAVDLG